MAGSECDWVRLFLLIRKDGWVGFVEGITFFLGTHICLRPKWRVWAAKLVSCFTVHY